MRIALTLVATFAIMNLSTFVAYGSMATLLGLEPLANGSPGLFFASVLVVKLGVATGFVGLYWLARPIWQGRRLQYALVWWASYAVIEIGQAVAPGYTWADAFGGIVAEAFYFPLSALAVSRLLAARARPAAA